MMGVYIKGMEMPKTGRYFVAVDNTDGKDKTVIAIMSEFERGDKTRPLLAVHEIIPVPEHGDLIDKKTVSENIAKVLSEKNPPFSYPDWNDAIVAMLTAPTIIPAGEGR